MIFGNEASELWTDIEFWKLISIVGARRSGKDLLACEIAQHYLEKDKPVYRFYANELNVWNDPLYIEDRSKYLEHFSNVARFPNFAAIPEVESYPDVRYRIFKITEGGRYLRKYEYFEDMFEFAGKFHDIFLFPSVRESHEDLMIMTIYPKKTLSSLLGDSLPVINNLDLRFAGRWGWSISDGYNAKKDRSFWFIPSKWLIGIFDTEDISESTDVILQAIKKELEFETIARGRDSISTLAAHFRGTDEDAKRAAQRRVEQAALALLDKQRRNKTG